MAAFFLGLIALLTLVPGLLSGLFGLVTPGV